MQLLVLFFTLIAMDIVWLTLRRSYHESLFASIQKSPLTVRIVPAILVYVLVASALYYFVFEVGHATTFNQAAKLGALLGGSMYGLYDLTNYATLRGYTLEMTIVDTLWGMITCGLAAGVAARV
jgi:uncharacterized membrane protein